MHDRVSPSCRSASARSRSREYPSSLAVQRRSSSCHLSSPPLLSCSDPDVARCCNPLPTRSQLRRRLVSGESPAPLVGVCGANGPPALHFAGSRILNESIRYLTTQHGLTQAKEVVVGGCSAGGLAVFLHADRWAAALPSVPRVVGRVDRGFFLDTSDPESKSTVGAGSTTSRDAVGLETMNATDGLDGDTHQLLPQPGICSPPGETALHFAQHAARQDANFIMQSAYDAWQVCHGDGAAAHFRT